MHVVNYSIGEERQCVSGMASLDEVAESRRKKHFAGPASSMFPSWEGKVC